MGKSITAKKEWPFQVDAFLIVSMLFFGAVLFIGFWTMFKDDFFAIHYGRLIHWIPEESVTVESTVHGKIAIYALFCVAPIALLKLASCFKSIYLIAAKIITYVFAVLALIGLIVLYYFLTKDLYGLIPHSEGREFESDGGMITSFLAMAFGFIYPFMADFSSIYIWYAAPFFFDIIAIPLMAILLYVKFWNWIKALLFGLIIIPLLVFTPFLIILTGAIIGFIIGAVIFTIIVVVCLVMFKNGAEPDGYAVDSDGHKYTRYGNTYIDSSGQSYTSYDGGKTIER